MEVESIFSPWIKYAQHENLTLPQAHHSHSLDLNPLSWPSPRTLAAVLEYLAAEVTTFFFFLFNPLFVCGFYFESVIGKWVLLDFQLVSILCSFI